MVIYELEDLCTRKSILTLVDHRLRSHRLPSTLYSLASNKFWLCTRKKFCERISWGGMSLKKSLPAALYNAWVKGFRIIPEFRTLRLTSKH